MIVIRKLILGILLMAGMATALILAGMFVYDNVSFGSDGLTGIQRAEAANITLSNHLVAFFLGDPNATYELGDIKRPSAGYYIDANGSRSLAVVPVHINNDYGKVNLSVTVDLDEKKTISVYFDERPPGITYKQQIEAIKIALEDDNVRGWMQDLMAGDTGNNQSIYYDGYIVDEVHPSGFGEYGYVDPFGFYVDVSMRIDSPFPMAAKYLVVTVDLAQDKVVIRKESYGEALMGSTVYATIPPAQSFYREYYTPLNNITLANHMIGFTNISSILLIVGQQPDGASLRPAVVDPENLALMKNNSSFSELNNVTYSVSGNQWSIFIPSKTAFYLVLKNEDNARNVNVTMPFHPF